MRRLLFVTVLAGCAGYQPGSFSHGAPFAGTRATIGCLDVAIERRPDMASAAVLAYEFGNRCAQRAPIDFANVVVRGRAHDGSARALRPYDPNRDLQPLVVDGRRGGREVLAYPDGQALAEICVDIAALAHQPEPRWLCVGAETLVAEVAR